MKIPYWTLAVVPAAAFILGFTMNAVVMAANGGQMPVLFNACSVDAIGEGTVGAIHSCMTATTHLKFLADWIAVRGLGIASPGDFLEWFGAATFTPFMTAAIALALNDLGLFKK